MENFDNKTNNELKSDIINKFAYNFSNNNIYLATSRGIFIYGLNLIKTNKNSNIYLNNEKTNSLSAISSFLNGNYLQAIIITIVLNIHELLNKFLSLININQFDVIIHNFSNEISFYLLEYYSKKSDEKRFEFTSLMLFSILKSKYNEYKTFLQSKFDLMFSKLLEKNYYGIIKVLEENEYSIEYILDQIN